MSTTSAPDAQGNRTIKLGGVVIGSIKKKGGKNADYTYESEDGLVTGSAERNIANKALVQHYRSL